MRHLPKININISFFKKNKILAVLLGIFILLVLIAIYPAIELKLTKKSISEKGSKNFSSGVFGKFNRDTLDEITIKYPQTEKSSQESLTMKKSASGWVIEDVAVDQTKLNRFMDAIDTLSLGDLLSKNPKNHMELGVSDALGTFVTFRAGSDSLTFVVGIPSAVTGSFYVRLANSNDVYLMTSNLRNSIIIPKADWTKPDEIVP